MQFTDAHLPGSAMNKLAEEPVLDRRVVPVKHRRAVPVMYRRVVPVLYRRVVPVLYRCVVPVIYRPVVPVYSNTEYQLKRKGQGSNAINSPPSECPYMECIRQTMKCCLCNYDDYNFEMKPEYLPRDKLNITLN